MKKIAVGVCALVFAVAALVWHLNTRDEPDLSAPVAAVNATPELKDIPLAATEGLPNLKGAKIEVVFADNQGTPAAGQN